jgi:hypothetical protein
MRIMSWGAGSMRDPESMHSTPDDIGKQLPQVRSELPHYITTVSRRRATVVPERAAAPPGAPG